jgi:hypothetical protein
MEIVPNLGVDILHQMHQIENHKLDRNDQAIPFQSCTP